MARLVWRALALGFLSLLSLAGWGCSSAYMVDVRNDSGRPIYATLMKTGNAEFDDRTLAVPLSEVRLGPGDRGAVSAPTVPQDMTVFIQADTNGNPGAPPRMKVFPGKTVVKVRSAGDQHNSPLVVEEIR